MIGVILVTHRGLSESLLDTAEHIVGKKEYIQAVGIYPGEGLDTLNKKIQEIIGKWKEVEGVLILVDMFGGTPCNASLKFLNCDEVEVVSGVNLAMVLTAITQRNNCDLKDLTVKITDAAKENILRIKDVAKGCK
ncbi:MAG: PTS sugar transporter subunit IIA [Elusimicrobiota bacterium]